jgi:meiotically up-regulated gene 157 (Mug157) protein
MMYTFPHTLLILRLTVGLENAWPMSALVRARTSDDDAEIKESIELVRNSSLLGLIHESVDVNHIAKYTRSWFAWANSVFAQTIIDLAENKPHLVFGPGAEPYKIA